MKRIFTLLWLTLTTFTFKATAQGTSCNAEFAVQYISNNTVKFNPVITEGAPLVQHYWHFGDGSAVNQQVSPTHTYALPGTYPVVHTVSRVNQNNVPVCTQSFTKMVTITAACNLVVDFSWTTVAANPLTIAFQNLSVPLANTDSIKWTFGDGSTSTAANPVHTYNVPGTYTVCLTVKKHPTTINTPCIKTICKTIIIPVPCNLVVNFSSQPDPNHPLRIKFTNLSTPINSTDSVRWTFGDGTSVSGLQADSNVANPTHNYLQPGTYNVCLRVKKNGNTGSTNPCVREICRTIVIPVPCNLVVDFNWTATATNPLTIAFHNLSVPLANTDSIKWTFGDGSSSTAVNPVHTYNVPGTYTVCLTVKKHPTSTNAPCIRYICKTVVIPVPCNLVVNFTSQPDPNHPLRIKFTNTSTPIHPSDSLRWTFGDGTSLSGVQSDPNVAAPTHNFTSAGTYTVCLRVKKNNNSTPASFCVREKCNTIVIPAPCNLVVNFTSQPDPNHPLRIKFTNTSTPIHPSDSLRWTFGDGTSLSGVQSDPNVAAPTHNYTSAGNYTVCLRVKKNSNTTTPAGCVREICKTIVVHHPCNIQVNFSWRLDSLNTRKVYFTNLTTPPTAGAIATWYFGDGSTATSWNAIHEYAQPGRYIVCLKIQFSNTCIREKCDTIFIPHQAPPCTELSKFRFERVSNDNQSYKFIPDYINTTLQYTWTFGDGTGSQSPIATHRYARPGVYTACLTVWRGPNCASTTCKEIRVQAQPNCDSVRVSYVYQADPLIPNRIHFYANSNIPIVDQTWTIKRLNGPPGIPSVILHQDNPTYLFQDTGYYDVCLRAVTLGGCVKEVCKIIHITQVSNACLLQAYPNPTSNLINVNVTLTQPEMIHAYVYNTQSVLVKEKHQQGVTGNNIVTMNVNDLAAGMYTIKLIYGNRTCYARFQKL